MGQEISRGGEEHNVGEGIGEASKQVDPGQISVAGVVRQIREMASEIPRRQRLKLFENPLHALAKMPNLTVPAIASVTQKSVIETREDLQAAIETGLVVPSVSEETGATVYSLFQSQ